MPPMAGARLTTNEERGVRAAETSDQARKRLASFARILLFAAQKWGACLSATGRMARVMMYGRHDINQDVLAKFRGVELLCSGAGQSASRRSAGARSALRGNPWRNCRAGRVFRRSVRYPLVRQRVL